MGAHAHWDVEQMHKWQAGQAEPRGLDSAQSMATGAEQTTMTIVMQVIGLTSRAIALCTVAPVPTPAARPAPSSTLLQGTYGSGPVPTVLLCILAMTPRDVHGLGWRGRSPQFCTYSRSTYSRHYASSFVLQAKPDAHRVDL